MNVTDLMVKDVRCCSSDTNLESAAQMMWDSDCGSIAVVDDGGIPIGIITDRDIAMASALNHKAPWDITASEVMSNRPIFTCKSSDDIKAALKLMQAHKVRRLPVTDKSGHLEGLLSIDDIVAGTERATAKELSFEDTMGTLKAVCKHH
jgi:CBS domain-containing protein